MPILLCADYSSALFQVIPELQIEKWKIDKAKWSSKKYWITELRLFNVLLKMIVKQTYIKVTAFSGGHFEFVKTPIGIWSKIRTVCRFFQRIWKHNVYTVKICQQCLDKLVLYGIGEVAIYGASDIARILYILAWQRQVKILAIYDDSKIKRFMGFRIQPVEVLNEYTGKIIIASLLGTQDRIKRLSGNWY